MSYSTISKSSFNQDEKVMSQKISEYLLIVESEPELREAIVEALAGLNCELHAVSSGDDAAVFVREHSCFAIVCADRLIDTSGAELCFRIKQEFPRLRFLVLSAHPEQPDGWEVDRTGIDDVLRRPQDLGRLHIIAGNYAQSRSVEIEQELEELMMIRKIFCDEANEILRDLESFIFRLEEVPMPMDVVDVLFRKVHTLKGSAGAFQGAEKVCSVTHACENLLQALKKGRIGSSQTLTGVLLQTADVIKTLVKDFESFTESDVDVSSLIETLNQWTEGKVADISAEVKAESREVKTDAEPEQSSLPAVALTDDDEDGILVSIEKLNSFMELAGELVVLKNGYHATIKQVMKLPIPAEHKQRLEEMNQSLDKISEQIQGQIMEVRKVQLKVAFQKFPRIVRQASQDLQKQVRLEMSGTDLGVDKSIAKALSSSLVHVIRNSVDHGIEDAQTRRGAGKTEHGNVSIKATQVGEKILVIIEDDGAGINVEKVKKKALEKGLVDADAVAAMTDSEAFQLIFMPGFSTADKVTNVSGRGVGMDVVKTEAARLGGSVLVDSTVGLGTKITVTIPVPKTVLVENTLLVESCGHQLVIPLVCISKITPIMDLVLSKVDGRITCQHDGQTVPLGDYRSFIDSPLRGSSLEKADFHPQALVLIISHKGHSLALVVDRVIDQLEAVVRPFDNVVDTLTGFKGTSLLDTEHVAFVLDAESLVKEAYAS
jgi:two-component system chemotaxis sensor kinase CheA